ncbi:bifunctional beta-cystathionase maltose regulon repressor [Agrilactobacillus composti DSM 18527 = JCM 14202]|uniref:cysteine-S-conjugate beta-lyase n=1 Tax=Agrilactobacillus composti DSM 18527 = JCM 14202 TaxID=1423734 RepID=A0A0R1XTG2_9LACO|nr:bifunctional beta-cystathionase maltose regulon repressor [Agrilactobacillus composti DSM 18527 = JCM 14202]
MFVVAELSRDLQEFVANYSVDRRNTDSLKWDALQERYGDPTLLPMWVADMEFQTPVAVRQALTERVQQGVFGYSLTPDSYYEAFFQWQKERHGITLQKDWVRFDTGVVNSLYAMVKWLTDPGDEVVILQPVYYPFANAIKDNDRKVLSVDLLSGDKGWAIDFEALEKTFKHHTIKLLIFCSPHNPVGRIWTEAELVKVLALCRQYGVQLVSDEIHQDYEAELGQFKSVLTVADGTYQDDVIVLTAPSKTFNLAALLNSHVIIPDPDKRESYDAFIKTIHQTEGSLLGRVAAEAAYRHGGPWFDKLRGVIAYNYSVLKETLAEIPEVKVADLQGTYLAYVDLAPIVPADGLTDFVQKACGLAVDYGAWFSPKDKTYIRLNLATDPKYVATAADRLAEQLKFRKK